jgi:pimeloyl-ACP methyl ester carboxylesterase
MRTLGRFVCALLALPAGLFLLFVLTGPGTWSGISYALGLFALTIAGAARGRPWAKRLALGSAGALFATVLLRLATAARGDSLAMQTGAHGGARLVDRVLDEEDLSVSAARTIRLTRFMGDPDVAVLPEKMSDAYGRMRAAQGDVPSPVVATYLGEQGPAADDEIEIGDVESSDGVVVFLHGSAGSFTLPCWEVSLAAERAHMATVCPATRWTGDWWSAGGEATVRDVVNRLRARGAKHLILAGLSNGGIGGSLLLPRFAGTFEGFVAISGAAPAAAAPGIPVLCVQGKYDTQVAASVVLAYAHRSSGTYVELEAGHFALLVKEDEAVAAIARWFEARMAPYRSATARR